MSAEKLLDAIIKGNVLDAKEAFESAIAEKMIVALETKRQEIAQSMFHKKDEE